MYSDGKAFWGQNEFPQQLLLNTGSLAGGTLADEITEDYLVFESTSCVWFESASRFQ